MAFLFIYEPSEFRRIIPAVLIDSRANIPAIKNEIGSVIKAYIDLEVDKVNQYVLFFKIETVKKEPNTYNGVLAGYFTLFLFHQGQVANLYDFVLRPSFSQFSAQISVEIVNFINSSQWKQYTL